MNIYIYIYVCNEYMLGNDGDRIPTIPWFGHAGVGSCGNRLVLTNKIVRKLSLIFRWESRSCSYITAYIYIYIYAIAAPQEDGKERNHNFSATLCLYIFFAGVTVKYTSYIYIYAKFPAKSSQFWGSNRLHSLQRGPGPEEKRIGRRWNHPRKLWDNP